MSFRYTPRSRAIYEIEDRTVSPQRLVHYRDNWYLDGWCHARNALRTFALDQMAEVRRLDETAIDVDDAQLDEILKHGPHVEVLEPESLRREVLAALEQAVAVYGRKS